MNYKIQHISLFLLLLLLLTALTGCSLKDKHFSKHSQRTATFTDGIWHGLILYKLPESVKSTPKYKWGVSFGAGWLILFAVVFIIIIFVEAGCSDAFDFVLSILLGSILGYFCGVLSGAGLYWSVYLIVYLIKTVGNWIKIFFIYLGGSIAQWFHWTIETFGFN